MSKITVLFFTVMIAIPAQSVEKAPLTSVSKGLFSVGLGLGYGESRILNTNGGFFSYKSNLLGADFDFQLFSIGAGEARLFVSYFKGNGKNPQDSTNLIESSETAFGIKFYINSGFYLGFGSGNSQIIMKNQNVNTQLGLAYTSTKISVGYDMPIGKNIGLGLEGSYSSGPISVEKNSNLSQNSYTESGGLFLRIIWAPPSITNIYSSK